MLSSELTNIVKAVNYHLPLLKMVVDTFPEEKEALYAEVMSEFFLYIKKHSYPTKKTDQLIMLLAIFPEHKEELYIQMVGSFHYFTDDSYLEIYRSIKELVSVFSEHRENIYSLAVEKRLCIVH